MIKLEDLKLGDKIYAVCSDGLALYKESIVEKELFMLDILPEPCEAVICKCGLDIVSRKYEDYIFRTEKEAEEKLYNIRLNLAKDLLKSDRFIDRLFECAISSKRLGKYEERDIYKIAVELYKEKLIEINRI